jgi:glycosyltransferase involved in cell wall biosynthesis
MPSKPFNILYLSSFGNLYGGGQKSLFYLVTNLDKSQFIPYVILPSEGSLANKLRGYGIEVAILKLPRIMNVNIPENVNALLKFMRLCRSYEIDLIHTDGPRNTFYAGLVARIKHIPLVWHVRASNKDRYDRFLYRLSSKIILVADSLRSRFDWISRDDKLVTIYNGVDLSEITSCKHILSIREQYAIDGKDLLISSVARVERLKGQKYIIEACGLLKDKLKDFALLLVGDITDVSYRRECEERASELGIGDCLIFTGYRDNVYQILNETDIFVLPSLFEAFPRSVIEAMGAGKPVIVTDVGGCREAVEDQVSGFVVPAGNAEAMADTIHVLATNSNLRLTIGRMAKARAEKMFSIQHNVRKTERVYGELCRELQ